MKRICVLLLAMALLLTVLVMPTVAEAPAVRLECESTPFTAVDSEGRTCATSNQYNTWAWSLNLNKGGIEGTISNNLAYFRSGGVNGYLDFSLENDALTAGTYEMYLNVRPNGESYCTVDFAVNGGSLLTYTFQENVESAG